MEAQSREVTEITTHKPWFRDTLYGANSERIDQIFFAGPQPTVADVLGRILSHLKEHRGLENLKFDLVYVDYEDQDRVASGDIDRVNTTLVYAKGLYTRLNWGGSSGVDYGGSAILMSGTGTDTAELQIITAASQPVVDPEEILALIALAYQA